MKIHEHQAKEILVRYDVPTPKGVAVFSVSEAVKATEEIGGSCWVLKAQIHAGGRGKGGGVKVCGSREELQREAERMLGMQLVTHQTGPEGQLVQRLLVEEGLEIEKEFYLSMLEDRSSQCPMVLACGQGGMDIEEVAAKTPAKIHREAIDVLLGFRPFQAARLIEKLEIAQINSQLVRPAAKMLLNLYESFSQEDFSLLEINPLALTADGRILALDAKVTLDDNASFRHPNWQKLSDPNEENPLERQASEADLSYIKLAGSIGCMVNGAGLAMATMDLIKSFGGEPANFLDVGGNATAERICTAFRIITDDDNVKCILINIFGGIVRCDLVAEGIIKAFQKVQPSSAVVVRLEGSRVEEARQLIRHSPLQEKLFIADNLKDAGQQCVKLAQ